MTLKAYVGPAGGRATHEIELAPDPVFTGGGWGRPAHLSRDHWFHNQVSHGSGKAACGVRTGGKAIPVTLTPNEPHCEQCERAATKALERMKIDNEPRR